MSLSILQPGCQPLGQFDGYFDEGFAPVGGEVGVLISTGVDADGFQKLAARGATTGDTGPFFLIDDGKAGYSQHFGGVVVKTDTGFSGGVDAAVRLGPASYEASGKLTLWDKPGLYAVSLDACYDNEAALKAAVPGEALTVDPTSSKLMLGDMGTGVLATVVQFKVNDTLVTTGGATLPKKYLVVSFSGYGDLEV